ncbi:DUF302 domain-containing protein [Robertkochia marina]|uniref:DUF302 domain-containing protein n=1 Tax=Robertkochia marina TaxID=1227945 RepID=A0A4S3M4R5_9FLAO|nr:DUF302 domain-containing protein [Robertkochia marina]THD69835.1 DUF302 domain-containing protein [Robertkochia marina]TRZ46820.1 DUF302 domain-containing protein [Robertkochia marina]
MKYYHSTSLKDISFDEAITKVTAALKEEGFGVLTDIDIQDTLKKKIGASLYKYRILGACNPEFAYKALQKEDKIGAMLPCNVIVQEKQEGEVEVSAVDPIASMSAVENPGLEDIAEAVNAKLQRVIRSL